MAIAAGVALAAYLQLSSHPYYPVAQVAAPEGLSYTAFSDEARGREACVAANERFIQSVLKECRDCAVAFSRCDERDAAIGLLLDTQRRQPMVHSPALRIAVAGPQAIARASCEHIAGELLKQGIASGRCAVPAQ